MVTAKKATGRTTAKSEAPIKPSVRTAAAQAAVIARTGVAASEPTSASAWKSQNGGTLLRVPSGNTCRVKTNVGMQMFLKQGKIPNGLMGFIQDAMAKAKPGMSEKDNLDLDVASLLGDTDKLRDILDMAAAVVVEVVLEPVVTPVPPEGEPRDPGLLYVDEVDFADQMYIFNFVVGGTADLERFSF